MYFIHTNHDACIIKTKVVKNIKTVVSKSGQISQMSTSDLIINLFPIMGRI
jgi:hypothetical protein